MKQKWHDLLFAHWPRAPDKIRPLVPQELELDLRDGSAWFAVAPFWMSGIRARLAPPLPFFSKFCELNVRTYVRYKGVPGVYFFSLDAASLLSLTRGSGQEGSAHLGGIASVNVTPALRNDHY